MNALTSTLKTILNGLAMQYEGEMLTTEEKKANLQRVLTKIKQEKQRANHNKTSTITSANPTLALNAK